MAKTGLVIAGLKDLERPPERLSVNQNVALAATGFIWVSQWLSLSWGKVLLGRGERANQVDPLVSHHQTHQLSPVRCQLFRGLYGSLTALQGLGLSEAEPGLGQGGSVAGLGLGLGRGKRDTSRDERERDDEP